MIRQIIAITFKELKVLWLDREALALLFVMPVFFILVMSFALEGVFEAGSKGHPIELLVVNRNGGRVVEQAITDLRRVEALILIEAYEGVPLTSDKAEQLIRNGVYPLALLFEEGFTEKVLQTSNRPEHEKASVYLISDPAMNVQLLAAVKGAIQSVIERRVLLARVPQRLKEMLGIPEGVEGPPDSMLGEMNKSESERSGVVFIHTFPKGFNAGRRPTATEQNIPGYTIFGVFFIVLTLASSFLQEKKDGTFQRILSAPLSKTALLIGKLLPYYLANLIQITLMFSVGVMDYIKIFPIFFQ